jgi:hypothetical protein
MARGLETSLFECLDCHRCRIRGGVTSEDTCPGCGSRIGRIISSLEVGRRIETGNVVILDLSTESGARGRERRRVAWRAH